LKHFPVKSGRFLCFWGVSRCLQEVSSCVQEVPGGERKHTEKGGEEALEGIRLPGKGISCQVWSFPVLLWACVELAEEEEREEKEEEEEEQKAQKEEKRRERRISGWPGFGYIR
jgi:hypothetical protein